MGPSAESTIHPCVPDAVVSESVRSALIRAPLPSSEVVEALAAVLDDGRPARMAADPAAVALGLELGLLTSKPVLYLVNTDDPGDAPADVVAHAESQGAQSR